MPMIDFFCRSCDLPFEAFRSVHSQELPPCPKCEGPTERHWIPARVSQSSADPVVVFKAPDGSYRFPGTSTGLSAANYTQQGFERIELRGWTEARKFEKVMNKAEFSKICRRVERQQAAQEEGERRRRSDFHHGLHHGLPIPEVDQDGNRTGRMQVVRLGAQSKDIARIIMDRNNGKRVRVYDPGFHIEVYSQDRSNREDSRDARGKRHRD